MNVLRLRRSTFFAFGRVSIRLMLGTSKIEWSASVKKWNVEGLAKGSIPPPSGTHQTHFVGRLMAPMFRIELYFRSWHRGAMGARREVFEGLGQFAISLSEWQIVVLCHLRWRLP